MTLTGPLSPTAPTHHRPGEGWAGAGAGPVNHPPTAGDYRLDPGNTVAYGVRGAHDATAHVAARLLGVTGRHMSGEDRQHATAGLRAARQALLKGTFLPAAAYGMAARHIAAAGALYHDDDDRVLLVQPRHRPTRWQLPGGLTEPGEDPYDTAKRRSAGLTLSPTAELLALDWVPADPEQDRPPLAVYVFDGGPLTANEARRRITLQTDELLDWRYAAPDEWSTLLAPHSHRRLAACLQALKGGRAVYLRHGWPPGARRKDPPGPL